MLAGTPRELEHGTHVDMKQRCNANLRMPPRVSVRGGRIRSAAHWSLVLVPLLFSGCSTADDPAPQRWIPEDPADAFSIERLADGLSRAELRELTSRPWKVELGNEHRNAWLGVSGDSFARNVQIPADGRMRLEYGVLCATSSAFRQLAPVRLQVVLERQGGDPESLWEARLNGDEEDRALQWNEATIDLSRYGGRQATVSIRTTAAAGPPGGPPCLIAVGNPEVTSSAAEQRALNVIVISVDTLRADRLSLYGHARHTTPEIDAWARERGTTFTTTVAQAPWTLPSHVSMLTSLDAFNHGVNYNSAAPDSLNFVAEVFRRAGYSTAAVTGGAWMTPEYGFSQGFDRYAYWPRRNNERELEENLNRFLESLSGHTDRRFFALFHTYEPHGPYRPRQPYWGRFYDGPLKNRVEHLDWQPPRPNNGVVDRRVEFVWRQRPDEAAPAPDAMFELASALYDSDVAYMDAQIGRLFRALRELELEDRTVVVFTSDHGEALGEHGLQGHGYPYDHNLLVPLIIAAPDLKTAGERVETQVRSIDIVPTLLELAGLPPLEGIDGQSLVPLMRGEESTVDPEAWSYVPKGNWGVALRVGDELKYIYNNSPWARLRARESVYFLEDDPAELNDLAGSAEGTREAALLRDRVQARLSNVSGLRVRMRSASGERLRGRLRGGPVQPQKIKTVDMPCDCLEWTPKTTVAFEVPPETTYTLLFHDVPQGGTLKVEELRLEGRSEIVAPESMRIDVQEFEGVQTVSLVDGKWELEQGYRTSRSPSLTLWWSGEATAGTSDPSADDPQLVNQLRALGYVD